MNSRILSLLRSMHDGLRMIDGVMVVRKGDKYLVGGEVVNWTTAAVVIASHGIHREKMQCYTV